MKENAHIVKFKEEASMKPLIIYVYALIVTDDLQVEANFSYNLIFYNLTHFFFFN